jgi:hypothetical protein
MSTPVRDFDLAWDPPPFIAARAKLPHSHAEQLAVRAFHHGAGLKA